MQNSSLNTRQSNSIRATFEDGMSTFLMAYDATFEDLAERLGHLSDLHQGRALAFDVTLNASSF
jgi:hypothetical protein